MPSKINQYKNETKDSKQKIILQCLYFIFKPVCLFWSIGTIYYVFIYDDMTDQHNVILNISTNVSCTSTHESIFSLFLDISYYLLATLPVLINLLLIVLRRAYLSCLYKIWVQIFTFYIISRILIPFLTSHFILIRHFCCLSVLPFVFVDIFVYINVSKNLPFTFSDGLVATRFVGP